MGAFTFFAALSCALLNAKFVTGSEKSTTGDFTLTILHTNDIHSHIEESNKWGGPCTPKKNSTAHCVAGVARLQTAVNKLRKKYPNSLFMNAGDFYQGSTWFTVLKYKIVSAVMTRLRYDAVCLGNHEFDDGPDGLAPFLKNMSTANIQVVTSNVETRKEPKLKGAPVHKSWVFEIGGRKIGVVGAVTVETRTIASPGKAEIEDDIAAIRREARALQREGVNIIVAITHTGYDRDMEFVRSVGEVDLLVGGHTNTFLYHGDPPAEDTPEGDYPTVIEREDGSRGLIVTAFWFGKYLGFIRVTFDAEGRVKNWTGNPILINSSVKEDPGMKRLLLPYWERVQAAGERPIGSSKVLLEADNKTCRLGECNMCNLIADAFFAHYADMNTSSDDQWSNVNAAVINSGLPRSSLPPSWRLTMFDVMRALPYESTLVVLTLTGGQLRKMFEHSVAQFIVNSDPRGEFLQVAGIRVTYDLANQPHHRVVDLRILCTRCLVPRYEPVRDSNIYRIVTTAYVANGGDGFTFDANVTKETKGVLDSEVYLPYIEKMSPIKTAVEGRVKIRNYPARSPITGRSDRVREIWY